MSGAVIRCDLCRFFHPAQKEHPWSAVKPVGQCRRHAPRDDYRIDGQIRPAFVQVREFDWCGEFAPRPSLVGGDV